MPALTSFGAPTTTGSFAGKGGVSRNRGNTFDIEVDPSAVLQITHSIESKLAGVNLERFLIDRVKPYIQHQINLRFSDGGDSKSGKWAPLADATQDIRAALGVPPAGPMNIRTALKGNRNSLFDFVTEHFDARSGHDWAELDVPGKPPDPLVAQKLKTAQQGSDNNPLGYGPTPPRPVLAHDETDLEVIMESLQGFIMLEVAGVLV